ncbi:MAG: ROK family protein [Egibacteraceae bacterium]
MANRADLGAVGEAWFGAGRAFRDVLYLDVAAGMGAGVVLGRRLVHGRCSLAEAGQMVLDRSALRLDRPATLGTLGSGPAMSRLASVASLDILWPEVAALVRTEDPIACGVWHEVTEAIALGVANLAHLFSPEVIVVGGGIDRTGDLLLEPLRAGLHRHGPAPQPIQTQVQGGALGGDACLIGAAAWHEAFNPEVAGRDVPEPDRRGSGPDLGGTVYQWPTRSAAGA